MKTPKRRKASTVKATAEPIMSVMARPWAWSASRTPWVNSVTVPAIATSNPSTTGRPETPFLTCSRTIAALRDV